MRYLASLPYPESVSKEARDLVSLLLHPTPEKRATIEDALTHPFLEGMELESTREGGSKGGKGGQKQKKSMSDDDDISGDEPQEMMTDEETFRFDEEEWNGTSEELAEVGSWEDQLANECKSF